MKSGNLVPSLLVTKMYSGENFKTKSKASVTLKGSHGGSLEIYIVYYQK
jgi:hypothetical protein